MEKVNDIIENIKTLQKIRKDLINELNEIENDRIIKQAQFIVNYGEKCGD